jgi:hypothetical protein
MRYSICLVDFMLRVDKRGEATRGYSWRRSNRDLVCRMIHVSDSMTQAGAPDHASNYSISSNCCRNKLRMEYLIVHPSYMSTRVTHTSLASSLVAIEEIFELSIIDFVSSSLYIKIAASQNQSFSSNNKAHIGYAV